MKSDKLQDALGMIDPKLIARADNNRAENRPRFPWIAPVAAMLAVTVCIGMVAGLGSRTHTDPPFVSSTAESDTPPSETSGETENNTPSDTTGEVEIYTPSMYEDFVRLSASLPVMAKYPGKEKMFTDAYYAWIADRDKQLAYRGMGNHLGEFFKATALEFLSDAENQNAVYSPLNVYFALTMLAEITNGQSRQQILDLFDVTEIESLRRQSHAIWNANYSDEGTVKSILGNSVWLDKNYAFHENTLSILKDSHYASVFEGIPGTTEYDLAFRAWLNAQTGGLANKLSDLELSPSSILTLASTIYFSARWETTFSEQSTVPGTFHANTAEITCNYLKSEEEPLTYYWGDHFSSVAKPLENSGNIRFVLPEKGATVDQLLSDGEVMQFLFDQETWNQSKEALVNLTVPKFSVQSNMDLAQGLKNLGITDCFSPDTSDFSPVTDEDVYLDRVLHGAGVSVDEEGVIAAAFTILQPPGATPPESKPVIDFVLDRPFLFVITGSDGLPLFVGIVNQP